MASPAVTYLCIGLALFTSVIGWTVFIRGVARIVTVIRAGADESGRWNSPWKRLWTSLRVSLSHDTFKNRPVVRVAHWLVMVSFVVLVLTLVASYGQLFNPLYTLPILGHSVVWNWVVEVLAALGAASIIALFAIRIATMVRAKRSGQPRSSRFFGSTRWQAWFVEFVVATVCLAVLFSHGFHYALGQHAGDPLVTPLHYPLTAWFGSLVSGWSGEALANAVVIVVTVKIVTSMVWMLIVGTDIAMSISWHRFLAPVNISAGRNADGAKSLGALALPLVAGNPTPHLGEDFEELEVEDAQANADSSSQRQPAVIGLGSTEDLTWKDRLDFMSCTECGRCQDLCPAWNTEKPLSPKLMIMALRDNVVSASGFTPNNQAGPDTADVLGALKSAQTSGPEGVSPDNAVLAGGVLNPDILWDCTMCGACVDQCPVDIEHIDHIGNMRRFQVLMESAFPRELTRPFRAMETKSNPYNQSPRKRLDWATKLDFDITVIGEDVEDATDLDYLFWVGCAGAYDEKAKRTTAAVAELLHTAGVSFGVLGSSEGCTGDPARRAGNEILFQMLAEAFIETLNEVKAKRIVVTCAHCFNSIANEFPQLDGHYEVIHHTQLLNRLVREGALTPVAPNPEEAQTVTYHDPCFLGRHNKIYEPPRELLGSDVNLNLVEMPQNRELAMCCGAGGARAWMEEKRGTRIASARVDQALSTGATTVATACPFCTQMLDSAIPSEAELEVKDVAVLLLEGVHRGKAGTRPRQ